MLPTPDVTQRGLIFTIIGGSGSPDSVYICVKASDDSYSWEPLIVLEP